MKEILNIDDIKTILKDRIKDDKYTTLKSLPQPDSFKDIQKATDRIISAIKTGETINVVGDYDVDGVVSTAIMVEFFLDLGVEVNYIIPNRFEHGYGLSPAILENIYDGIVVTVDNGISAIEAADICTQRGLDLIITDHHTVSDSLPKAYAIVNPKQKDCQFPFKDICGAQVAWYLCASIKKGLNIQYDLSKFFDLLALAIVADIMPMVSLNQTMTKHGLKALSKSNRPAIVALRERYGLTDITEEDIGFKFAPLINCAGRMSDPSIALEFLLSFDEYEAAYQLDSLVELNEKRKQEQLEIFNEAKKQVSSSDEVIVVASDSWNEGIIGIVASKLCEKYKKPAFVFSINDNIAKASSRSVPEIHLYNLINYCKDSLIGFGGHKQAAGLKCETKNIAYFKDELNKAITILPKEEKVTLYDTIGVLPLEFVGDEVYRLIESFRPYGQENPYPLFTFENLKVLNIIKMGKNKEFTKLSVSNGIDIVDVVIFNDFEGVDIGETITFTATILKNEFRGETNYNLLLKELI